MRGRKSSRGSFMAPTLRHLKRTRRSRRHKGSRGHCRWAGRWRLVGDVRDKGYLVGVTIFGKVGWVKGNMSAGDHVVSGLAAAIDCLEGRLGDIRDSHNAAFEVMYIRNRGALLNPSVEPIGKLVTNVGLAMINDKAETFVEEQIVVFLIKFSGDLLLEKMVEFTVSGPSGKVIPATFITGQGLKDRVVHPNDPPRLEIDCVGRRKKVPLRKSGEEVRNLVPLGRM